MLSTVDELGTGRIRLPLEFAIEHSVSYGQPITVECEDKGVKRRFLCTASVAIPGSAATFDASVQCGLQTGCLPQRSTQLRLSVKPVSSKVIPATSLKVLVPEQLLASPVPAAHLQQRLLQQRCTVHLSASVSCQVLEATPAGPAAAVYRVVPSTAVTLVSSSGSSEATAALGAAAEPRTPKPAAGGSSSKSSKAKSRSAAETGTNSSSARRCSSSSSKAASSSSSKQAVAKKPSNKPSSVSSDSGEEGAAVPGGMFGLLDALEDD